MQPIKLVHAAAVDGYPKSRHSAGDRRFNVDILGSPTMVVPPQFGLPLPHLSTVIARFRFVNMRSEAWRVVAVRRRARPSRPGTAARRPDCCTYGEGSRMGSLRPPGWRGLSGQRPRLKGPTGGGR